MSTSQHSLNKGSISTCTVGITLTGRIASIHLAQGVTLG